MESHILVPLRSSDQIRQVMPYLYEIARPRMKLLFLVQSRSKEIHEVMNQLLSLHTGIDSVRLPWGNQHDIAQQRASLFKEKVFATCAPLAKRGVEIRVTVYRGSLRRVLREHVRRENVQLVIMCPASRRWALALLQRIGPLSRAFNFRSLPPVLLLHRGSIAPNHA
jgi:hypothetical protein